MNNLRKGGRFSFRSNKRYSYSRTNNSFAHNKVRPKGNIPAMYEKYIKMAKEATSTGDRIQAEYYLQFADHYSRIMTENGIKPFEQEDSNKISNKETKEDSSLGNDQEINKSSTNSNIKSSEKVDSDENSDENENSLDTVSFISQPVSKTSRSKK